MLTSAEEDELSKQLLPCPFCGLGNSCVSLCYNDMAKRYQVYCGRCGSSSGTSPKEDNGESAIKNWNKRPESSRMTNVDIVEMRIAIWYVGNMDSEEDRALWSREFDGIWTKISRSITQEEIDGYVRNKRKTD